LNFQQREKKWGREKCVDILVMIIEKGQMSFNISVKMDGQQMSDFADIYFDQYKSDGFEDLIMAFQWAAEGRFGTVFNRIDSATIFGWLNGTEKYDGVLGEKAILRESIELSSKEETKKTESKKLPIEKQWIKKIYAKIQDSAPKEERESSIMSIEQFKQIFASEIKTWDEEALTKYQQYLLDLHGEYPNDKDIQDLLTNISQELRQ